MSQKIYVGNLSFSVSNDDLQEQFEQYGAVTSVNIVKDRDTGRSKGFGFIEMSTSTEASNAIEGLNGKEFQGRMFNISEAKPMEKRDNNRSGGSRFGR